MQVRGPGEPGPYNGGVGVSKPHTQLRRVGHPNVEMKFAGERKKGPAGGCAGPLLVWEKIGFLFEGKGEIEDEVAYGNAQGKFAGFCVADVPEFA